MITMTRTISTALLALAMTAGLSACNNERTAEAETSVAEAEVSTTMPEAAVSDAQLEAAANVAAAEASVPTPSAMTPEGATTAPATPTTTY